MTNDLFETFTENNRALNRCCEPTLKQQLPNKQIALITDTSLTTTDYVSLVENDPLNCHRREQRRHVTTNASQIV